MIAYTPACSLLIYLQTLLLNSTISMDNSSSLSQKLVTEKHKALPVDLKFKLPSPLPVWPQGDGFATRIIDLGGGLKVCHISSFSKIWATNEGGPDNLGASFYEPSEIPDGFSMLGCYSQPNNTKLFGWVLAAKDEIGGVLSEPIDYTLVWSSDSSGIKQQGVGYIWLPKPPPGYSSVGLLVTNSPVKPPLEKIRCVRSEFTEKCHTYDWIWGLGKEMDATGFNVCTLWPTSTGTEAMGVGTFIAQVGDSDRGKLSLACLKNTNSETSNSIPNLNQVEAIFRTYAPKIYFHPDEQYLPSSVTWFFQNGALLYKKGEESKPVPVEATGSNLPQGGWSDGTFWLDLPIDQNAKERVKKGNLGNSQVYLHIKQMLGATCTDIAVWVFYPFNGPARAKVEFINVPLGRIGEHVGDWEHVTLRVSNLTGELQSVYFAQHGGGTWVSASELEFQDGNKVVAYSALHGHPMYPKPGLVLQGSGGIGLRNDSAKSNMVLDTGEKFTVVAAEYLGNVVKEPDWLNYCRVWGPKISYDIEGEIKKVEKLLPGKLKSAFDKFIRSLPSEVLGEEGPTGPKMKSSWNGDEE